MDTSGRDEVEGAASLFDELQTVPHPQMQPRPASFSDLFGAAQPDADSGHCADSSVATEPAEAPTDILSLFAEVEAAQPKSTALPVLHDAPSEEAVHDADAPPGDLSTDDAADDPEMGVRAR